MSAAQSEQKEGAKKHQEKKHQKYVLLHFHVHLARNIKNYLKL